MSSLVVSCDSFCCLDLVVAQTVLFEFPIFLFLVKGEGKSKTFYLY